MSDEGSMGLEIAVVGMAGRFPGCQTLDDLWEAIIGGRDLIQHFSDDELLAFGRDEREINEPSFVGAHGALDSVDLFDHEFFGYSRREAALMDPQQRIFLEVAYQALEDAGVRVENTGPIGVFGGASANTYLRKAVLPSLGDNPAEVFQGNYSNNNDFLCTRTSYKLDLTGPSITVQSACSTSLVAVVMAVQSLLSGACDVALAGGVSVSLPEERGYHYQEGMIFSPDATCRTFDEQAEGTLKGDGAGIVVLKRLEDALADGDRIDAVILGGAINNDGGDKVGYTAPGFRGQVSVIQEAQDVAGIDPRTIGYVEAHGTATPLGDPLEIAALSEAFAHRTKDRQFAAIGSVKSTLGHLDAAAGVAGLIKAILSVRERIIPPAVHFRKPNPQIDFAASPVYPSTEAKPYPPGPARACVSSFGIGGSNAHVIVEAPPPSEIPAKRDRLTVLPIAVRSPGSIEAAAKALAQRAQTSDLVSVAGRSLVLRGHMEERAAIVASSGPQAAEVAAAMEGSPRWVRGHSSIPRQPVFLFPGQGAQRLAMGSDLAADWSVYREEIERLLDILKVRQGIDLAPLLSAETPEGEASGTIQQTQYAQPALVAVGLALAKSWQALGVQPSMVLGHSIGELAAASIAGVLSSDDAIDLAGVRGQLMQACPTGDMLSVSLSQAEVEERLGDHEIDIAAVNSSAQTVVSGPAEAVARFSETLGPGVVTRKLATSHAFHSRFMENAARQFAVEVARRELLPATIPIVSTVTGRRLAPTDMTDPDYWARNIRQPVMFANASAEVLQAERPIFVELGPGGTLLSLLKKAGRAEGFSLLDQPREDLTETEMFYRAASGLWCHGVDIDLEQITGPGHPSARLPSYPFDRKRCWIEQRQNEQHLQRPDQPRVLSRVWTQRAIRSHRYTEAVQDLRHTDGVAIEDRLVVEATAGATVEDARILAHRLAQCLEDKPLELILVTRYAFRVLGDEPVSPEGQAIAAFLRVVCQEHHAVSFTHVDLDADSELRFAAPDDTQDVVAIRNARVWSPGAEKIDAATKLENQLHVLIGGAGGAGLMLAEALLQKGDQVVLVVRNQTKAAATIQSRPALSKVPIYQADVVDEVALSDVFDTIEADHGTISVVAHLAGIAGEDARCFSGELTAQELEQQLSPKRVGASAIAAALRKRPDVSVRMFASLASSLGAVGASAYSAANAYLDTFAEMMEAKNDHRWISIAFDRIAAADEKGMVADELLACYENAHLAGPIALATARPSKNLFAPLRDIAREVVSAPNDASLDAQEGESELLEVWRDIFSVPDITATDNFFELGGDSVICLQIVARAKDKGFALTTDLIFDHQTVRAILSALPEAEEKIDGGTASSVSLSGMSTDEIAALEASMLEG